MADDDYAPVDPTSEESDSYSDGFTQDKENGSVWITGYQSEGQLPENSYAGWDWKQIEAAILGGAAVDDGPNGINQDANDQMMKGLADPQSLWNAAEILAGVHRTMTTVADSLLEQVNSLAGENGSWKGEGAESFRNTMEKVHRYIATQAKMIIGTGNVPEQLWADGSYLDWAQQEIRKIDAWYAQEALEASGGDSMMSNNKVQISAHPEIVVMMTADMRQVAQALSKKYMVSVNSVTIPYTADLDMPGGDTSGSEIPPEDYYPESPPPEDYYPEDPPPEEYSQQEGPPDTGAEPPPPDAFSTDTPPPGDGAGAPDDFGAGTPPPGDGSAAGAPDDFGAGTPPPGDGSGARAPDAFGAGTPPPDDLAGTGSPDDFAAGSPPSGSGDAGGQGPLPVTPFGGTAPPGGAGTGNRPAGSGAGAPDPFAGGTGPDGLPGLDPLDTSGTGAPGPYAGDAPPSTEVPVPEDWATGGGPGATGGGLDDRGGAGMPMMPPPMMGGGDPGSGAGDKSDAAGLLGGESEPWTGGTELPPYEPAGGDAPVRDPADWATTGGIGPGVSTTGPGAGMPMMPPPMMGGGDPGSGAGDKSDAAGLLGGESEPWVGASVPPVSEPDGGAAPEEPAEWATSGAGAGPGGGGVPGAPVMPPPMMGGGDPGSGAGDKSDAAGLLGGESEQWMSTAAPVGEPGGVSAPAGERAEWAAPEGAGGDAGVPVPVPVLPPMAGPPLASAPSKSTQDTSSVGEVAEAVVPELPAQPPVDDHVPVVRPSTEHEDTSAWNVLAAGGALGFLANLTTKPRKRTDDNNDDPDGPGPTPVESPQAGDGAVPAGEPGERAVYRRTRDGKVIMDAPGELRCTDWLPPGEASDDEDDPDDDPDPDAEEEPRTAVNLLKQSGDAWGDTSRTTSSGVLE